VGDGKMGSRQRPARGVSRVCVVQLREVRRLLAPGGGSAFSAGSRSRPAPVRGDRACSCCSLFAETHLAVEVVRGKLRAQ
jgi:hypothetical protein